MFRLTSLLMIVSAAANSAALSESPAGVDDFVGYPRLFVLTDIGNEPDDQMSFVRLLLYANELDIEGLVATTSTWQKDYAQPELLSAVLDAYGEVHGQPRQTRAGMADGRDAAIASHERSGRLRTGGHKEEGALAGAMAIIARGANQ